MRGYVDAQGVRVRKLINEFLPALILSLAAGILLAAISDFMARFFPSALRAMTRTPASGSVAFCTAGRVSSLIFENVIFVDAVFG
jgi:hypothetical protein